MREESSRRLFKSKSRECVELRELRELRESKTLRLLLVLLVLFWKRFVTC